MAVEARNRVIKPRNTVFMSSPFRCEGPIPVTRPRTGETLGGRFAPNVTARYLFGPVRVTRVVEFGSFRLDTVSHRLWRGDERVSITPKAFDLLRYLIERRDRLVSQREILEALWPQTHVNPEVVKKHILEIRKALGDRSSRPIFIETFPKRGYQFVAPVRDAPAGVQPSPDLGRTRATMVGRAAAMRQLDRCLDVALSGARQLVFVTGEA